MLSRFDPIIRSVLRRTEKASARHDARRKQDPQNNREHDRHSEDDRDSFWEDRVEVSVDSLDSMLAKTTDEKQTRPATTLGQRADKAYRHAGIPGQIAQTSSEKEHDDIQNLRGDLAELKAMGVKNLFLDGDTDLYRSLKRAIARIQADPDNTKR